MFKDGKDENGKDKWCVTITGNIAEVEQAKNIDQYIDYKLEQAKKSMKDYFESNLGN